MEVDKLERKVEATLKALLGDRYHDHDNVWGSHDADRHDIVPRELGVLSRLHGHRSGADDSHRLIVALEGLTELQVESILTIIAAVAPDAQWF